jgi:hypothetical protein
VAGRGRAARAGLARRPGLSDYTAPLAAELEDAFGVIRCQQRGLAPSTTSGPFSIGQHAADVIAVPDAAGPAAPT